MNLCALSTRCRPCKHGVSKLRRCSVASTDQTHRVGNSKGEDTEKEEQLCWGTGGGWEVGAGVDRIKIHCLHVFIAKQ